MRTMLLLLTLLPASLSAAPPQVIEDIFDSPCAGAPQTRDDLPLCADYNFDSLLIESADNGDRSALALLRTRFDAEPSDHERYRIADVLLHHRFDADAMWAAVEPDAQNYLRLDRIDGGWDDWCSAHACDPARHGAVARLAFDAAAHDPRSRPLMAEALASPDSLIVCTAISTIAAHRDLALLPEIARALERMGDDAGSAAQFLARFNSDAADAIALKYLDDDGRAAYEEARHAQ